MSLQFLREAAHYAIEQGDYAKQEGSTIESRITDFKAETDAKLTELESEVDTKQMRIPEIEAPIPSDSDAEVIEFRKDNGDFVGAINEEGIIFKRIEVGDEQKKYKVLSEETPISHDKTDDLENFKNTIEFEDNDGGIIGEINDEGIIFKSIRVGTEDSNKEVLTESIPIKKEVIEGAADFVESVEFVDDTGKFIGKVTPQGAIFKSIRVGTEDSNKEVLTESIEPEVLGKITNDLAELESDVELLKSRSGGVSFSTPFILSDVIEGNDLFIVEDYADGCSATSFVNIWGVLYLEYENLHKVDQYHPVQLFDKNFAFIGNANVKMNEQNENAGSVDLSVYPTANYAVFTNMSNDIAPTIKLYVGDERIKNKRNDVLVGAYYFAGWSELDFPNIHHTSAMLNQFADRKPTWGWIDHASFKGEGWLITPKITLQASRSTLKIFHSCLFHKDGQCEVYIRRSGGDWQKLDIELPSSTSVDFVEESIAIDGAIGEIIQIGFCLKTAIGEESAIWTINKVSVYSNGQYVYEKDYTNHANLDCEVTDTDVWKPATWTRAYKGLNGYVGTTINQKDTSIIDKQIVLAKQHGIDYFMLEWFYYDNKSAFNKAATEAEDNHIAVHAFMRSCQKNAFKFAIMITNHEPFVIQGVENWKDAMRYCNETYFKDPSYLFVDNKPVISIFDKSEYIKIDPVEFNNLFITEFGYDGVYILYSVYNVAPNSKEIIERPITELYDANKEYNIREYKNEHIYNFVTCLTCGWDSRPWAERPTGYARPTDWYTPNIQEWRKVFDWSYRFAKAYNNHKFRSVLICAWNEYGEGSYLTPTKGDPRATMLVSIGETISKNKL